MKDLSMEYTNICKSTLQRLGIDIRNLTDDQIELLAEPIEAPENFCHDGEVTNYQAIKIWKNRLLQSGLSQEFINSIINKIVNKVLY